jgi:hypothetical protein
LKVETAVPSAFLVVVKGKHVSTKVFDRHRLETVHTFKNFFDDAVLKFVSAFRR